MIGRFKDAETATETSQVLEQLTELVSEEARAGEMDIGGHTDRFSTKSRDVLSRLKIYDIGPEELEQFGYDFSAKVNGSKVVLTTDESDVSAFLKVLIDREAVLKCTPPTSIPTRSTVVASENALEKLLCRR